MQQYDRAIADYDESIRVNPNYAWPHNARGWLLQWKLADEDQALTDYDEAIRLDPKLAYAYVNRGILHRNRAEWAKAARRSRRGDPAGAPQRRCPLPSRGRPVRVASRRCGGRRPGRARHPGLARKPVPVRGAQRLLRRPPRRPAGPGEEPARRGSDEMRRLGLALSDHPAPAGRARRGRAAGRGRRRRQADGGSLLPGPGGAGGWPERRGAGALPLGEGAGQPAIHAVRAERRRAGPAAGQGRRRGRSVRCWSGERCRRSCDGTKSDEGGAGRRRCWPAAVPAASIEVRKPKPRPLPAPIGSAGGRAEGPRFHSSR